MKITKLKIKNHKKGFRLRGQESGYTVLELLFYVSFFATFSILVVSSLITMTQSFKETSIQRELVQSGGIMERISREIRQAYDIGSVSASDLNLNTTDGAGANKTVQFLLVGTNIQLLENSVLTGDLNAANIVVTGLTFTQITTAKGKAVKILLTVRSSNDPQNRTVDFYDTIVLRGDY